MAAEQASVLLQPALLDLIQEIGDREQYPTRVGPAMRIQMWMCRPYWAPDAARSSGSFQSDLSPGAWDNCPADINLRHNRTLNWKELFGHLPIPPC